MALVAEDIIDSARDFHPSFIRNDFPNKMLLRQLYRLERSLVELAVRNDEEALAVNRTIPIALLRAALTTENGVTLPAHYLVLAAKVRYLDEDADSKVVEFVDYRETEAAFPSASLVGQRLHPFPSDDWDDTEIKDVLIRYVPVPEKLETMDQELTVPDAAEDALVHGLALFMATRGNKLAELPTLAELATSAAQSFLATLGQQDSTTLWMVRRVS